MAERMYLVRRRLLLLLALVLVVYLAQLVVPDRPAEYPRPPPAWPPRRPPVVNPNPQALIADLTRWQAYAAGTAADQGTTLSGGLYGDYSNLGAWRPPRHVRAIEESPGLDQSKGFRVVDLDADDPRREFRRGLGVVQLEVSATSAVDACNVVAAKAALTRQLRWVQPCYDLRLAVRPDLTGSLSVRWEVLSNSQVELDRIDDDRLGDPPLAECVLRSLRRTTWQDLGDGRCVFEALFTFTRK